MLSSVDCESCWTGSLLECHGEWNFKVNHTASQVLWLGFLVRLHYGLHYEVDRAFKADSLRRQGHRLSFKASMAYRLRLKSGIIAHQAP